MKKILFYIFICLSVGLTSCVDEDIEIKGQLGEGETMAKLTFCHNSFEEIQVNSRATLNEVAESKIENLFVYIFDHTGKRVYSHFFDNSSKVDQLPAEIGNFWTVNNRTSNNNTNTHGEVLMKVPVLEGGSIYVIANLNADMMNISADQLYLVESLDGLRQLNESLNQEITSRNGYFLMSGGESNINIAQNGSITKNNSAVKIHLNRLDAKVSVEVKLGTSKIEGQTLKRFVPESWQVMRLPKACRLIEGAGNADELGFFDSEENHFENYNSEESAYSFSFYCLENLKRSTGLTNYHQREERHKNPDGTYDLGKGVWKHVDDNATYMVIKGRLQMFVNTDKDYLMQHLEADVTYFVHLGDFGSSINGGGDVNDFSGKRNTHYKYTITVRGVENIDVEVETNDENQSGAIGDIYKSHNEIYTYDAHYGQRVYCIDSRAVEASTLTWYVNTPFGQGRPGLEFGTENPNLDYKWAWFMVNDGLSEKNQWYPGDKYQDKTNDPSDKLWDAMEFTEWLRAEKNKFDNAPDSEKGSASAFTYDPKNNRYVIFVTVFVDEYYYEKHPLTNTSTADFWKQFVNKPNRLMHILCDSKESKDGDSSITNSIITLRQRSIQTPYNTEKGDLTTAWGCETEDEFIESQLFYFDSENEIMDGHFNTSWNNLTIPTSLAPSDFNGLYNSIKLWDISLNSAKWETYFDYERPNDYSTAIGTKYSFPRTIYFLKEAHANHRYASLMRNRDNNGDGIINDNEIRWYVASLNQLYDLYFGQLGLVPEAYLYTLEMPQKTGKFGDKEPYHEADRWRNHIISSTWKFDNNKAYPQVLWAEEGLSISRYQPNYDWGQQAPLSTRCVRNLGIKNPSYTKEGSKGEGYPEMLINSDGPNLAYASDGTSYYSYYFDLSNINRKSLRYYTTHELALGNENFETSKLYYGFETGKPFQRSANLGDWDRNRENYLSLINDLEMGKQVCPTGYRVPNVREGAMMALYCKDTNFWKSLSQDQNGMKCTMVSTKYSNGSSEIGGNDNDKIFYSWHFGQNFATIGESRVNNIIPVRDVVK